MGIPGLPDKQKILSEKGKKINVYHIIKEISFPFEMCFSELIQ